MLYLRLPPVKQIFFYFRNFTKSIMLAQYCAIIIAFVKLQK